MKLTIKYRPSASVIAFAAAVLAIAGSGSATADAATIHGCANNHTGVLRLAVHCAHNEHAVTWNRRGPVGRQGSQGLQGARGIQGLQGPPGNSSGPAGGVLTGAYPDPTLNVSDGPCANGLALTNISAMGALTCAPGVYSDNDGNVAAGPTPFGSLQPTLTTGADNVAFGPKMMPADTTGTANSAFGGGVLERDTVGGANSGFGDNTLTYDTTGGGNSGFGQNALTSVSTGLGDSAFGYQTGGITTGDWDTFLGSGAGSSLTSSESNDIELGAPGTSGQSNAIHIGGPSDGTTTGNQDALYIAAAESNVGAAPALEINTSTGQIGIETSSKRFKTDISPLTAQSIGALLRLVPVSFRYKAQYAHGANPIDYGLIAEQVANVYPNLVAYSSGKPYTVLYQELPVLLLAEVQNQQRQIDQLQSENRRLDKLQSEVNGLMRR
jgi:hypothetical protein